MDLLFVMWHPQRQHSDAEASLYDYRGSAETHSPDMWICEIKLQMKNGLAADFASLELRGISVHA